MVRRALGLLVVALLLVALPSTAEARVQFQLKGQWTCKDGTAAAKPLAGARVELWHSKTAWRDQKVTTRHTDSQGRYSIPVNAEDHFDLYVKLLLHDDDGVKLENWYSPFTWETTTSNKRSRSGTVDLGTWQIGKSGSGTPKCAIWQGVHDAYANYRQEIGQRPPSPDIKIEAEFPCCGAPFATRDTIRWPGGYGVDNGFTPRHEFGHTIRHTLDGDFLHFTADVANFQYPQFHESCKVTNAGFAFNEGWAAYWAGRFNSACAATQNLNREGDVAAALTRLEKCSNRRTMLEVLRRNRRTIHSFELFQVRWGELTGAGCAVPLVQQPLQAEQVPTVAQQLAELQRQIAAQRRLVASLKRRAGRAGLVASTELTAQAQQAALVLRRLEEGLAAARGAGFDPARQNALGESLTRNAEADALAYRRILNSQLDKAVRQIRTRPGLKRLRRGAAFRTLKQRAGALNVKTRGQAKVDDLFAAPPVADETVSKTR